MYCHCGSGFTDENTYPYVLIKNFCSLSLSRIIRCSEAMNRVNGQDPGLEVPKEKFLRRGELQE